MFVMLLLLFHLLVRHLSLCAWFESCAYFSEGTVHTVRRYVELSGMTVKTEPILFSSSVLQKSHESFHGSFERLYKSFGLAVRRGMVRSTLYALTKSLNSWDVNCAPLLETICSDSPYRANSACSASIVF